MPAVCASLLHAGDVDLGLIPAIEYLRRRLRDGAGHGDRLGRPVAVGRDLHHACRSSEARTLALDTSSRTSVALTRILCAKLCGTSRRSSRRPRPTSQAMLGEADAALVIGDPALAIDTDARRRREDRPRRGVAGADRPAVRLRRVERARRRRRSRTGRPRCRRRATPGWQDAPLIAREAAGGDAAAEARALGYLRDTLRYGFGDREQRRSRALPSSWPSSSALRPPAVRCGSSHEPTHSTSSRRGSKAAAASSADEALHLYRHGADLVARADGRRRPPAQAPGRRRHLHHRPQRQLHERLRRALQLLRVLPPGRPRRGLRPRRSTRSSGRSTRPSRSAATSCCCRAGTIRICRCSGTRTCSGR